MIKMEDPREGGNDGNYNAGSANGPTRESTKKKAKIVVGVAIAVILIAAISTCANNRKAESPTEVPAVTAQAAN